MTEHLHTPSNRPARILIVDDEPLNVDYLEQELAGLGFVTETAANGLEALERVAAGPPDLVLLDLMMPELDGIGTLRLLKGDPETRLIPVVVMTALNAVEDRVRGIEAGADDFLTKPVDERELLARIRTSLSVKRAIDETVDELRSTSAHLETYGQQEREVAVLAIDWRVHNASIPDDAVAFIGRSQRAAAEKRIRSLGGTPAESEGTVFVAVFEGADARSSSIAAVEAANAVVAEESVPVEGSAATRVTGTAVISTGLVRVGSTRVERDGKSRWVYGAEGEPVERAFARARDANEAGVLVEAEVAALVSERFRVEPAANGAYSVRGPTGTDDDSTPPSSERRIATILVTDIVGSTKMAERLGDRAWSKLVVEHEAATRSELAVFGGEEIDAAGDGFMISFDRPARAIRCAFALRDRLSPLGLTIRAGLHTGEVEQVEGRPRGIALHLASRIAASANPGEVLVSATTRELAAGAGLLFADRGEHALSGVSEPRRLYTAVEAPAGHPLQAPGQARPADTPAPSPTAGAAAYPAGLTQREVDVLRLVAVGLSDAEVASQLFLSVRTVNAHLRSVYRKLNVRSRAAAGRFAEENGLL